LPQAPQFSRSFDSSVHRPFDAQKVAVGLMQFVGSQTPFVHRVPLHAVEHEPHTNGFEFVSRHALKSGQ
jgi:hypothetical protein